MPHPYVSSATIKNNVIEITIELDHHDSGSYVEVSGSATQTSGAYANFYDFKEVPAGFSDTRGPNPTVNVSAHPLPPNKFRKDEDVTVVIRVAKVWLTVLGPQDSPTPETTTQVPPADEGTTWSVLRKESNLGRRIGDAFICATAAIGPGVCGV
jgi:hypothetical protein